MTAADRARWSDGPEADDVEDLAGAAPMPYYVVSPEQRRRWRLARSIALEVASELGGTDWAGDRAFVWRATRVLYRSPIPTDPAVIVGDV